MVEQNELMYLNVWDNKVRQASYFSMGTESALNTFAKNKSGSNGTFSNPNYKLMQAVSFDPTGSGRRDHVAFVGVSGQNKRAICGSLTPQRNGFRLQPAGRDWRLRLYV